MRASQRVTRSKRKLNHEENQGDQELCEPTVGVVRVICIGRWRMLRIKRKMMEGDKLQDDVFGTFAGAVEVSMQEAMAGEDRSEWESAILSEITSLVKKDTWEIVNKQDGRNVVGWRYVLTNKCGPTGAIEKRQARVVAKGYSQRYGVDYHFTFAPVARLESIRLLFAVSVELGLKIHQVDIANRIIERNP